jgi:putative ABC transport system substrate-binding protein
MILAGCKKEENLAIGIVQTVDHPTLTTIWQGIVDEIKNYNLQNEKPIEIVNLTISKGQLLAKDTTSESKALDIDLLLAISSKSLYDICQVDSKIPIIFTAVSDVESINSLNPPAKIMTGVSDMIPIESQLKVVRKIIPGLNTIGIIYNPEEKLSLSQVKLVNKYAFQNNINCIHREVNSSEAAINAVKNLLGEIDALYVPSDLTVTPIIRDLTTWTDLANKPIISGDERGIEQGALCTVVVDYYKLGRQTGKIAVDGLTNKISLENHPIEHSNHNKILINRKSAEKLNIIIPSELHENISL